MKNQVQINHKAFVHRPFVHLSFALAGAAVKNLALAETFIASDAAVIVIRQLFIVF